MMKKPSLLLAAIAVFAFAVPTVASASTDSQRMAAWSRSGRGSQERTLVQ